MSTATLQLGRTLPQTESAWRVLYHQKVDAFVLGLALCAVPVSIAIAESLLALGAGATPERLSPAQSRTSTSPYILVLADLGRARSYGVDAFTGP